MRDEKTTLMTNCINDGFVTLMMVHIVMMMAKFTILLSERSVNSEIFKPLDVLTFTTAFLLFIYFYFF